MNAKEFVASHPSRKGPKDPLYSEDLRVELAPLEDVPAEIGRILSYDWSGSDDDGYYIYVVEVEQEFIEGPHDDGLRELSEDQIAKVLNPNS